MTDMDPFIDFLTDIPDACIYDDVFGIILAGGQSSRFNGEDKGLIQINNKPMIEHVIDRLRPQVSDIIISANRNIAEYKQFKLTVVKDKMPGFLGPLSGVLSALEYIPKEYAIVVPCDTPFLPQFLVADLMMQLNKSDAKIAVASIKLNGKEFLQPTFMLLKTTLKDDIEQFLREGGRKITDFLSQHKTVSVIFDDPFAFENINNINDLQRIKEVKC